MFMNMQQAGMTGMMTVSDLFEYEVYNQQNQRIGDIEDVVLDSNKQVRSIIIGVGGFLGIGERYVAVDPSAITFTQQNNTMRAMMNATADQLRSAPEFSYSATRATTGTGATGTGTGATGTGAARTGTGTGATGTGATGTGATGTGTGATGTGTGTVAR